MTSPDIPPTGVLLDLDGTLVDSVYPHVVAWYDALRAAGHTVAMSKIHSGIGMGSDRLLPWLLGGHLDGTDELSDDHKKRFLDRAETLVPTAGANALLDDLERREVPFLISTSAGTTEREVLLAALGRDDLPITGADDVASSKPAPDLLVAARAQLEGELSSVIMVGDAPWDALAATRAGMTAVAVRCGGFGDDTLRSAGASRIVDAPLDLIGTL
jgi:phosphoglycolate phosphatase-like HAD superfamily hydrolase